jgi:fructosamine-3-kinase
MHDPSIPGGSEAPRITEFHSTTWVQTKAYAEARIDELRRQNDRVGLTEAQTNAIRGAIAELQALLKQAEPKPKVPHRNIYTNRGHDE